MTAQDTDEIDEILQKRKEFLRVSTGSVSAREALRDTPSRTPSATPRRPLRSPLRGPLRPSRLILPASRTSRTSRRPPRPVPARWSPRAYWCPSRLRELPVDDADSLARMTAMAERLRSPEMAPALPRLLAADPATGLPAPPLALVGHRSVIVRGSLDRSLLPLPLVGMLASAPPPEALPALHLPCLLDGDGACLLLAWTPPLHRAPSPPSPSPGSLAPPPDRTARGWLEALGPLIAPAHAPDAPAMARAVDAALAELAEASAEGALGGLRVAPLPPPPTGPHRRLLWLAALADGSLALALSLRGGRRRTEGSGGGGDRPKRL